MLPVFIHRWRFVRLLAKHIPQVHFFLRGGFQQSGDLILCELSFLLLLLFLGIFRL